MRDIINHPPSKSTIAGWDGFQLTEFCSHSLIVKAAAILTLAAAPYLILCGLPLAGLPDADEVTRVEITYFHTAETKIFSGADDIKLARKAAGHLRHLPFASLTEEDPRYTIVFVTRPGERISLTAGFCNIDYRGRMMCGPYQQGELFVKAQSALVNKNWTLDFSNPVQ